MSRARKIFLVKCFKLASKRNIRYQNYAHLYQVSGDILYGECTCKAGCGRCCNHAGAALYQLVEYRQLDIKVYLMTKHALTFFKSDRFLGKDKMKTP